MNDKSLLNPDYILATHEDSFDGKMNSPIVTEEDMAWIAHEIGKRSTSEWNGVEREKVVIACWKRFAMKLKQECP